MSARHRLLTNCAIALVLAAGGVFSFHATMLEGATGTSNIFIRRDLFGFHYPLQDYAYSVLRQGHLPLWNPYQLGGVPFLATLQAGTLYPLHLSHLFLPTHQAIEFVTVLHIVLVGWLTFVYVRLAFGVSRTAALLAGWVCMTNSYTLYISVSPNILASIPWLPLLFLGVDRGILTRHPVWALAIACGIALPILGGSVQLLSYEVYALVLYIPACLLKARRGALGSRRVPEALGVLALGFGIGILVSAPQWLPTAELSWNSVRPPAGLTALQIDPLHLPSPSLADLMHGLREPISFYWLSAIAIVLALVGVVSSISRTRSVALATIAILSGLLSFGPMRLGPRIFICRWALGFGRCLEFGPSHCSDSGYFRPLGWKCF